MITDFTYNWPLQHFSQDNGLASHTTYVALVLYVSSGTYSLMSTPNDRFLKNLLTFPAENKIICLGKINVRTQCPSQAKP